MKTLIVSALASVLLASTAMAQAPAPRGDQTPSTQAAPVPATGQWRGSKLMGVNVYNEQNEKLGEISELIVNRNGTLAGAVIGVGGFLGMGEHNILVPMERIKFSNEAGKSTTGATRADNTNKQWYPDRAVLNASKDQLKSMPQFKY